MKARNVFLLKRKESVSGIENPAFLARLTENNLEEGPVNLVGLLSTKVKTCRRFALAVCRCCWHIVSG